MDWWWKCERFIKYLIWFIKQQDGKKENVFLFLNTIFWAVLAFVIGAAAFTLITGTIAGHGVSLFCITGYAGMIIGFFGGSYYLYRKEWVAI